MESLDCFSKPNQLIPSLLEADDILYSLSREAICVSQLNLTILKIAVHFFQHSDAFLVPLAMDLYLLILDDSNEAFNLVHKLYSISWTSHYRERIEIHAMEVRERSLNS